MGLIRESKEPYWEKRDTISRQGLIFLWSGLWAIELVRILTFLTKTRLKIENIEKSYQDTRNGKRKLHIVRPN